MQGLTHFQAYKRPMTKTLVPLFTAGLIAAGCSGDANDDKGSSSSGTDSPSPTFSPYEQVATVPAVQDGTGGIDHDASEKRAANVAQQVGEYVAFVDDSDSSNLGLPDNWILAGAKKSPTTDKVKNAVFEITNSGGGTAHILEFCNHGYAAKAMGVSDIGGIEPIARGHIHAPALPCELSVHYDKQDEEIQLTMLDPDGIFRLFFTDVLLGPQMSNSDFKAAMGKLPGNVGDEIRQVTIKGLERWKTNATTGSNPSYTERNKSVGPEYTKGQLPGLVAESPNSSPFVHYTWDTGGDLGTPAKGAQPGKVADYVRQAIDNSVNTPDVSGTHYTDWDTARPTGSVRGLPGLNRSVEMNSDTFSGAMLGSGRLGQSTALPVRVVFKVISDNDGQKLLVSHLDPQFAARAMFKGEASYAMEDAGQKALADMETMVKNALTNYSGKDNGVTLDNRQEVTYKMTP